MGLFSTLKAATAAEAAEDSKTTTTSALDIPSVVQLYCGSTPISVATTKTGSGNNKHRKFSVLSYQTAHVASSSAALEGGALLSKQEQEATALHPNLGVWNCRVGSSAALVDEVFKSLPASAPTVCLSLDLSSKTLAEVEPTMTLLQDALVRYLIDRGPQVTAGDATATTTLYDLRKTFFGLAVNDEEAAKRMSATSPEESDKKIRVSLVISVVLAAGTSAADYKDKQAEALVFYHLRKFAHSLNAVLCFVRKEKPTPEEAKAVSSLTMNQLAYVWHQIAQGEDGWKSLDDSATDAEENKETSAAMSGIYGPGNHQEDLIEAVMLRNAQYPGQWDASKDSLWTALPPPQKENVTATAEDAPVAGDGVWLGELRASVATEAKTPPTKKATPADKEAATKTPNDAAVSSFFESLLKP